MRLLNNIIDSIDMNLSKLWEIVKERGSWCTEGYGVAESEITSNEQGKND